MALKHMLTLAAMLGLFLAADAPVLHAAASGTDPMTSTGHPRRNNTTGADFGSDVELGVSGSTPGIILNQSGTDGTYRTQAAGADDDNTGWGLLGLLGLLGLSGLRSRRRSKLNA